MPQDIVANHALSAVRKRVGNAFSQYSPSSISLKMDFDRLISFLHKKLIKVSYFSSLICPTKPLLEFPGPLLVPKTTLKYALLPILPTICTEAIEEYSPRMRIEHARYATIACSPAARNYAKCSRK